MDNRTIEEIRKNEDKLIEENIKLETICRELGHELSDLRKKKYENYYVPQIVNLEEINEELQTRIDKAIEYIWSTKYEWGDLEEDNEDFDIDVYKLLNILKGE